MKGSRYDFEDLVHPERHHPDVQGCSSGWLGSRGNSRAWFMSDTAISSKMLDSDLGLLPRREIQRPRDLLNVSQTNKNLHASRLKHGKGTGHGLSDKAVILITRC